MFLSGARACLHHPNCHHCLKLKFALVLLNLEYHSCIICMLSVSGSEYLLIMGVESFCRYERSKAETYLLVRVKSQILQESQKTKKRSQTMVFSFTSFFNSFMCLLHNCSENLREPSVLKLYQWSMLDGEKLELKGKFCAKFEKLIKFKTTNDTHKFVWSTHSHTLSLVWSFFSWNIDVKKCFNIIFMNLCL